MAERMAGAEEGSTTAAAGAEAAADMDIESSRGGWGPSFEFAFDAENFSDKVLQVEVVASGTVTGKRRRKEKVLRVKTMYINSAILAARSPFFLKLFSNGMKESDQRDPTLRIADSDENALMELLSFMYSGKLTTDEPTLLLDILMAADKFEVASCMRHCYQLLTSLPLTTESALLYLDHPYSRLMAAEVQLLIGAAKEFLANEYKDYNKFREELMNISLAGIEAILSSSDLDVDKEDHLYYLLLKWARVRYPKLLERRKILSSRLLPLVRFSHMTCGALQKILTCTDKDIDHEQVTKLITGALLCRAYPAHEPGALAACTTSCFLYAERAYKHKQLKVVAFDKPCPQVIAYMDLKCEECSKLFPSDMIFSHQFHLAGHCFGLGARCNKAEQSGLYRFRLYLYIDMKLKGSTCVSVKYEFAARNRPSGQFVSMANASYTFTDKHSVGHEASLPWSTFLDDDSPFFIDGVLHLRVDLTVVGQTEPQT
uniref:Uncharacterized protein n=1 Tax=Avena sativa TaxID=4498 RepID=A0ACD5WDD7_AVESA